LKRLTDSSVMMFFGVFLSVGDTAQS